MALLIPAIKGKIGNTEYYETTMRVRDLIQAVRRASELDEWANFSIEERMQRELDDKRVREQIVPYLTRNEDRFFGSLIVLIYKGEVIFETIADLKVNVPGAYKANAHRIGFVTIDGGSLIVLDGQHRLAALKSVYEPKQDGVVFGPYVKEIADDEVCVIFLQHENSVKTRRIFNTVNRYAKQTSRGDNIITSEDDGYAIVTRRLLRDDEPLGNRDVNGKPFEVVNWKSNTLTTRSKQLTTISAVYETAQLILTNSFYQAQTRPDDTRLDEGTERVGQVWKEILSGLKPYQDALLNPENIPAMRDENASSALLFKPAAQIALVRGLLMACHDDRMTLAEAVSRANKIDWRMHAPLWEGVLIKASGAIDAGSESRTRAANIICWMIAADVMTKEEHDAVRRNYNLAFGIDVNDPESIKIARELPEPVDGVKLAA
ncbi:DNA sulfur modification protein DndB [Mesorhizobium sp. M0228]|uniref:DNA sulfur modification protein DndB n=1 Tax=Mesorhizobium sp. M0228 TaxID=2956923 RepID=UPI0033387B34